MRSSRTILRKRCDDTRESLLLIVSLINGRKLLSEMHFVVSFHDFIAWTFQLEQYESQPQIDFFLNCVYECISLEFTRLFTPKSAVTQYLTDCALGASRATDL